MKKKLVLVAWFLCAISAMFCQETGSSSPPPTAPPTMHIKGQGCVKAGNVPGCYVVNDYKAHRKYNIFFLRAIPDMDTGITFEGIGYSKQDSHCKQGQKIQVSEWKPLAGECPQAKK